MSRQDELDHALEAMFFGFKAMIKKPDEQLLAMGYSRVHHRILYFIKRNSKCSVQELLDILDMTKQYIHKPLKTLIIDGYVQQNNDTQDKRIKRLSLTEKGKKLEKTLSSEQRNRFAKIFAQTGKEAEKNWHQVMQKLIHLDQKN